ncbi:LuxR C-terminal-related transcriptional regulator (plasmid) [Streptomyces clavuligerus]|nr:hypothetical protein SSCG_02208 [Streptomyces clavuligerus]WDN56103.1 LuxR C-terminal-related transcriptional regulator [Streptomyces clavuligerus]
MPYRPGTPGLPGLSGRRSEVLAAIGNGRTSAEIAERFVLSGPTVKKYAGRTLTKNVARGSIQDVILAYACGLVRAKY